MRLPWKTITGKKPSKQRIKKAFQLKFVSWRNKTTELPSKSSD